MLRTQARLTLSVVWCLIQTSQNAARPVHFIESCGSKKIAVLDLSVTSKSADVSPCDMEDNMHVMANCRSRHRVWKSPSSWQMLLRPQVRESSGVIYKGPHPDGTKQSHISGTHAAPWFLAKAIRTSGHFTEDLEQADLVFVDDYCLQMKWLAQVHSYGHQDTVAAYALDMAYDVMIESHRWQRHHGADFIFFDSHPGFRWGAPAIRIQDKICNVFVNSTMLVPDRPMRTGCRTFLQMPRVLVTPYNPNSQRINSRRMDLPVTKPFDERGTLLYNRATCHVGKTQNAGKSFRWYLSQEVFPKLSVAGIDVTCTNVEFNGQHQDFEEMMESMTDSKFCLALPGDSASTRRLSEIMLANCIPVFAGPPYHSMPFHESIDWSAAGVFFNISSYSSWLDGTFHWELSTTELPDSPNDGRWWSPDTDPSHLNFISVDEAAQVSELWGSAILRPAMLSTA